jgi:hypothetical protein
MKGQRHLIAAGFLIFGRKGYRTMECAVVRIIGPK